MIKCHDCDTEEGNLHIPGCDMERCPFCLGQLISCNCRYKILTNIKFNDKFPFLKEKDSLLIKNFDTINILWELMLEFKGRIPYIDFPNLCIKCGKRNPEFFKVSNEEWEKFIPMKQRNEILCIECYEKIKELRLKGDLKLDQK